MTGKSHQQEVLEPLTQNLHGQPPFGAHFGPAHNSHTRDIHSNVRPKIFLEMKENEHKMTLDTSIAWCVSSRHVLVSH